MAEINYYGRLFDEPLAIQPAVARAANIAATFGKALIKAKTPVDTGKLKSQWDVKLEGNGLRITNPTNYAGFVEFGTRKMSARSMMTSSLPEIQSVFIDELYQDIGEAIGADLLTDFQKPGYDSAVVAKRPGLYPEVGNKLQPKITTGLSKRTKNTTKSYLFSNPAKILSGKQEKRISQAKPLYQKKARP
jgi:HK97 gp10 family phage protein